MRSKIMIDLDHDNQPIIKIDYYASEDVRDKMVKRFLETFGESSEATFMFINDPSMAYPNSTAIIRPVYKKYNDQPIISESVLDDLPIQ